MVDAGGKRRPIERTGPLRPGRTLGRYRLCFELAKGGMGAVYLARVEGPAGFDKLVALKCIHEHLAEDTQFVEMFLDEARIAARITHSNVCSVFDFGVEDGTYYIAMEYLLGETAARIARHVSELPDEPPLERIAGYYCNIAAQAAEGLHAAHQLPGDTGKHLDVIHRDVSPSNLFVCYDGNVQVMDFGIARAAGRIHVTQAGALKGKMAYMAPEQLQRLELDRRVDVWSLGVVLWEMLTGERLFRRETEIDTLAAVAQAEIPPPSSVVPGLPARVDEIVLRALTRDRDERYQTAREMARDLHRFVATLPDPVGVSELGEFMEELFDEERARRLELVDQARKQGIEGVPGVSAALRDEISSSSVRVHAIDSLPTQITPPKGEEPRARGASDARSREAERGLASAQAREAAEPTPKPAAPVVDVDDGEPRTDEPEAETLLDPTLSAMSTRWWKRPSTRVQAAVVGVVAGVAVALAAWAGTGDDEEAAVAGPPSAATGTPPAAEPSAEPAAPDEAQPEPAPDLDPAPAISARPAQPERPRAIEGPRPAAAREEAEPEEAAEPEEPARPRPSTARPRRPQPRAPAAPGVAVVIATGGWADVYENGQRLGRTPARLSLRAGRHVLELRPFGEGPPIRRTVVVPADGETRVAVPLSR